MIAKCSGCKRQYWSYRPNFPMPPAGYCSLKCYEERDRKTHTARELDPEAPASVLEDLRGHLLDEHGTTDITAWFECAECERLNARYAAALAGVV